MIPDSVTVRAMHGSETAEEGGRDAERSTPVERVYWREAVVIRRGKSDVRRAASGVT